jgi:D-alanine--poly(phosphoribitol) ligase subunit 2
MIGSLDTKQRVMRLLLEKMSLEVPSPDTDLIATGHLDSLNFAVLLQGLESEFGIRIELDDLEIDRFRSIARIVEFLGTPSPADAERTVRL